MYRTGCIVCCWLITIGALHAQVNFHSIPNSLQMFPRDAANNGTFVLSGVCLTPGVKGITTELRQEVSDTLLPGILTETFDIPLTKSKWFSVVHNVPARLNEFSLFVFEVSDKGQRTLVRKVKHLVAGDFYLIAGQSNAEAYAEGALAWQYDSLFSHPACRAIGASFHWATSSGDSTGSPRLTIEEDAHMGRPSSRMDAFMDRGFVNTWGLEMQYELAVQSGIPNCFVNAARGGLSIDECMPFTTPCQDSLLRHSASGNLPALPYDRAFKKLALNNASHALRAIFWYQGETEGLLKLDSAALYQKKFSRLYDAWNADYPALEKVFVLQVSMGCGGESLRLVADIQRRLPETHQKVLVMSTVGFDIADRAPDRCHYSSPGWRRLAGNLVPLAYSALYGDGNVAPLLPANVIRALYNSPTEMVIQFTSDVSIDQETFYSGKDTGTVYARDNFFSSGILPVKISSVTAVFNEIHLSLADSQEKINDLTFLPGSYTHIPTLYAGPWIRNKDNPSIGALVFYRIPVEPFLMESNESNDANTSCVMPVPANDHCWVIFNQRGFHEVTLYDVFGTEQRSFTTNDESRVRIDLSDQPAGIYYIRSDRSAVFQKIIKAD